jgi:Domain of unknown function (DUF5655)
MEAAMSGVTPSVQQHFDGRSTNVRATYDRLLEVVGSFGEFTEDPKKTSIHLNRRTAFAGVAARKESLNLTIKSAQDIASPRVHKHERASANRWHLEVTLSSPADVDAELTSWLQEAYELSA